MARMHTSNIVNSRTRRSTPRLRCARSKLSALSLFSMDESGVPYQFISRPHDGDFIEERGRSSALANAIHQLLRGERQLQCVSKRGLVDG